MCLCESTKRDSEQPYPCESPYEPPLGSDSDLDDDSQLVAKDISEEDLEYELLLMDGILGDDYDVHLIESFKKLKSYLKIPTKGWRFFSSNLNGPKAK